MWIIANLIGNKSSLLVVFITTHVCSLHRIVPFLFFLIFLTFIYFWDRERQSMNRGGAEREGDTESKAGSRLWAVSTEPDAGLELTDCEIMTWVEVGRLTDQATQAPWIVPFQWDIINCHSPMLFGIQSVSHIPNYQHFVDGTWLCWRAQFMWLLHWWAKCVLFEHSTLSWESSSSWEKLVGNYQDDYP